MIVLPEPRKLGSVRNLVEATEVPKLSAQAQDRDEKCVFGNAQHLLNDEGSNKAFEMVYVLSSHITVEGKLETDRNEPVKINVFLQKADKLWLMLLDGFGHTVADIPQGYLHG